MDYKQQSHYTACGNPLYEPRKIIEAHNLGFNLGNVIKYVLRAPFKGSQIADLKKAIVYIEYELEKLEDKSDGV